MKLQRSNKNRYFRYTYQILFIVRYDICLFVFRSYLATAFVFGVFPLAFYTFKIWKYEKRKLSFYISKFEIITTNNEY